MNVIAKYQLLFILVFGGAFGVSAQGVLWETYSNSGKQALEGRDYAGAERLFSAALKEAENLSNPDLIAKSNVFIGAVYAGQEKWDEAERFFVRAIEIRERAGEKDSDEITYALSNLGLTYAEQKKYDKAEAVLRRAITIREKPENPDLAVALLNLEKVMLNKRS